MVGMHPPPTLGPPEKIRTGGAKRRRRNPRLFLRGGGGWVSRLQGTFFFVFSSYSCACSVIVVPKWFLDLLLKKRF